MLTQSRGGLLGFLAGGVTLFWLLWPRTRIAIVAAAFAGLTLLVTPLAAPARSVLGIDSFVARQSVQVTTSNFAAQERLAHWGGAWNMWLDSPWLGIGAGNFAERYREFTPTWRFRISRGHAHSAYLQAGAQAGVIGLVAYLTLLGTVWMPLLDLLRRAPDSWPGALPPADLR